MTLEFVEAKCNEKENAARKEAGKILKGFNCENISAPTTLYTDVEGKVNSSYRGRFIFYGGKGYEDFSENLKIFRIPAKFVENFSYTL